MRTSPLVPALLLLVACGDKAEDSGTSVVLPDDGVWAATGFAATSDSCGWEDGGNAEEADTEYALVLSDGSFTLGIPGGQTIRWECELADDASYTCTDDVESTNVAGDVVEFTQGLSGSFTSSTGGTAVVSFDSACQSSDCDGAADAMDMPVPCGFVAEADFAWVSAD